MRKKHIGRLDVVVGDTAFVQVSYGRCELAEVRCCAGRGETDGDEVGEVGHDYPARGS